MLPGHRSDYRTTSGAFKWIVLIALLGSLALIRVFNAAVKDMDRMYREAGYGEDAVNTNKTENVSSGGHEDGGGGGAGGGPG